MRYGRLEVYFHAFLTSAPEWRYVVTFMLRSLLPRRERLPSVQWIGGCVVAKSLSFPTLKLRSSSSYIRGAQILEARSTQETKFCMVAPSILGPQYRTCIMSRFWRLEFAGGAEVFGKFAHPCRTYLRNQPICLGLHDVYEQYQEQQHCTRTVICGSCCHTWFKIVSVTSLRVCWLSKYRHVNIVRPEPLVE